MKALIISADLFEDSELLVPYYRLLEEGIDVDIASISRGKIVGKHTYEIEATKSLKEVNPNDYALLILPGGKAPAVIRQEKEALDIAKAFFARNKLVATICHGAQTLISAGLVKGRHVTCYKAVAEEMKDAGANYEDKEVIVDGNLISSRQPSDIPVFCREIMKNIKAAKL